MAEIGMPGSEFAGVDIAMAVIAMIIILVFSIDRSSSMVLKRKTNIFIQRARFYQLQGEWEKSLVFYRRAVRGIDQIESEKIRGDCHHGIAYNQYRLGCLAGDPEMFHSSNKMNELAWKEYVKGGLRFQTMVTITHIGNTLVKLSEHEFPEAQLKLAIGMYHRALALEKDAHRIHQFGSVEGGDEEWDLDAYDGDKDPEIEELLGGKFAVEHGNILNNMGSAYRKLAKQSNKYGFLIKAVRYYNRALKIRSPDEFPEDYAITMRNLGNTHIDLYRAREDPEDLIIAAHEFKQAIGVYTVEDRPDIHRSLSKRRDRILRQLGRLQSAGT